MMYNKVHFCYLVIQVRTYHVTIPGTFVEVSDLSIMYVTL